MNCIGGCKGRMVTLLTMCVLISLSALLVDTSSRTFSFFSLSSGPDFGCRADS